MDPMRLDPTVPELIDIWQSAIESIESLCTPLTDEQWLAQTPCPGWTVADIAAHAIDIESFVGGEPGADHTPNWDDLPHAVGPLSQFIETGIDYRRGRSKDEVLAELRSRIQVRRAQLDALPADAEVVGISGKPSPLPRVIRTRTFDLWAHEQDIRSAIGQDGNWSTPEAVIAFQQMAASLPYVWGKGVGAPAGATVQLTVTGPELEAELYAAVDDDGKAMASAAVEKPTVHVTLSWPDYMRLTCGRVNAEDPELLARVSAEGDPELVSALLTKLTITP